jgi:hypothetical protein
MPESPYPGPPPPGPRPDDSGPAEVERATEADDAPPAADAPPPEPTSCAVCGAELDPGQAYCLECGSPTPSAPRLSRGSGGLLAVAAGLAVLGIGAGALAYVASGEDGGGGTAGSPPATAPLITVPTASTPTTLTDSSLPGDTVMTTPTVPMDTTFTTPTVDTTSALPVDPSATVPDSGLLTETAPADGGQTTSEFPSDDGTSDGSSGGSGTDDWPAGTSGWTVIVASDTTESGARAAASRLQAQGQPGGVLFSSDHPPLRPGYWVAFSGTYTTRSEALSHARTLVSSWPGAYPRQVDA